MIFCYDFLFFRSETSRPGGVYRDRMSGTAHDKPSDGAVLGAHSICASLVKEGIHWLQTMRPQTILSQKTWKDMHVTYMVQVNRTERKQPKDIGVTSNQVSQ